MSESHGGDTQPPQCSYGIFAVGDDIYCLWDWELRKTNLSFLDSLAPNYYLYIAKRHFDDLDGEDKRYAAIALRNAYYHGMETLFALLLAAFQAPHCIFGWILNYYNTQLRNLVGEVRDGGAEFLIALPMNRLTWESASEAIFQHYSHEDKSREQDTKELFADFWSRLSYDFTEDRHVKEYNSIKHGFRIGPGGIRIRAGVEETPGEPAPPENMQDLGGSEFGSSFLVPEPIKGGPTRKTKPHFQIRRRSINWFPETMLCRLELITMSLRNIISAVKIWNGVEANSVKFLRPKSDDAVEKAWQQQTGVLTASLTRSVREVHIDRMSEDQLRAAVGGNVSEDG